MTAAAIGAKLAVVHVVGTMTITAAAVDTLHPGQSRSMAIVTTNFGVRAIKRKVGLQVVIECPEFPGNGVMTGITAIAHIALVRVVVTVARDTVDRFVGIGLAVVTAVAFLLLVFAQQGEARQVMVEKHRVLPVDFGMTALTLRTKYAIVWIVVEVARVAARH